MSVCVCEHERMCVCFRNVISGSGRRGDGALVAITLRVVRALHVKDPQGPESASGGVDEGGPHVALSFICL